MEERIDGRLEGIYVAARPGGLLCRVATVAAVVGGGLVGDRHANVTLIEAEALERLAADRGIRLPAGDARRNLVTRGVALNDLVGRRFRVGDVHCVGVELCHPCRELERMTSPGVLKGLVGCGGLRADVVAGGDIRVGDLVRECAEVPVRERSVGRTLVE